MTAAESSTEAAAKIAHRIDNLPGPKKCTYRAIELVNGAGACLVTEEEGTNPYRGASESNFVVSLGVGRLQDPPDCRGLAELCAELTLLEPKNNSYGVNVCDDLTVYRIESSASCLDGLLEKLSEGIRNPRFDEADIKSAIESARYQRNKPALDWLQRCSGNPAHPFYGVAQTNSRTVASLETAELRNRLIEFHALYYSGNLLRIFVADSISMRTIDELETLIATTFGDVPNRSAPKVDVSVRELDGVKVNAGGIKIRGKTMNIDGINLVFPLPNQASLFESSPDIYVKRLLLSNHTGSLNASLDLHGFYLHSAKLMDCGQLGFDFFCICVSSKVEKYQIEEENLAIKVVFRYLAMIRSTRPQKWLHNEFRVALESEFAAKKSPDYYQDRPADKMSLMNLITDDYSVETRLQRFPLRDALTARHFLTVYSEQAIADFLSFLTPDRCIVYVSDIGWNGKAPCTYKYPNGKFCCVPEGQSAEYSEEKLPPTLLSLCSAPWPKKDCNLDKEFQMPTPKPFVPTDFSLRPRVRKAQPPGLRQLRIPPMPNSASSNARLWFRQDDKFQSERVFISIDLIPPIELTPKNQFLLDILFLIFSEALENLKQQADEVNMELSLFRGGSGIQICFSGYSETLPQLMNIALRHIAELQITEESIVESYSYALEAAEEPIFRVQEVEQLASELGLAGFSQFKQKFDVADSTEVPTDDLMAIAGYFCTAVEQAQKQPSSKQGATSNLFADILVFGNATAEDAVKAAQSILTALPSLASPAKKATNCSEPRPRERLLEKGSYSTVQCGGADVCVAVSQSDCYTGAASICALVIQIPVAQGKPPMLLNSAMKALGEEFGTRASHNCLLQMMLAVANDVSRLFDRVQSSIFLGYYGNCFVFQKIVEDSPAKMEQYIETFIAEIGNYLSDIPSEVFETYKQQSFQSMQELTTPKSIEEQHWMYWTRIASNKFEFDWGDPQAVECIRAIVDGIRKEDLLNYWKKWLRSGSSDRSVLCLQNYCRIDIPEPGTSGKIVTDLEKFKNSLESPSSPLPDCLKNVFDA